MLKKIKYFMSILLIILLTGCSSYSMNMSIDKSKNMDLGIIILSDSEEDINQNIDNLKIKYEQYSYIIEKYDDNNLYGIKISKHFDNIDNISFGTRSDEYDLLYLYNNDYSKDYEIKMFNLQKGIDTNRYAANFYIDLSSLEMTLDNVEFKFSVNLPSGTLLSNNANLVNNDGTELVWNINPLEKNEIDFTFELKSYDVLFYIGGIILALFLIFAIFGNLFGTKSDSDSSDFGLEKSEAYKRKIDGKVEKMLQGDQKKENNVVDDNIKVETSDENNEFSFSNLVNNNINDQENNDIVENENDDNFDVANLVNINYNQNVEEDNSQSDLSDELNSDNLDDNIIKVNNEDIIVNKKKKDE